MRLRANQLTHQLKPYLAPGTPKPGPDRPLTHVDILNAQPDGVNILQEVEAEQLKQVQMAIDKHKSTIFGKYSKYRGGVRSWAPGNM